MGDTMMLGLGYLVVACGIYCYLKVVFNMRQHQMMSVWEVLWIMLYAGVGSVMWFTATATVISGYSIVCNAFVCAICCPVFFIGLALVLFYDTKKAVSRRRRRGSSVEVARPGRIFSGMVGGEDNAAWIRTNLEAFRSAIFDDDGELAEHFS
jgi:hypothetical protein